ncbi:MAG: 50S ribosomal protein L19 [Peptoniphilaceae bacterium]|uniref:50S ribosomal protein L19 n=1 Tax=Parvimonas sp. TaxID=1944660 RepID=UPI0025E6CF70|nr:50S ribosomal protein L19 [Parvimonas sp.]MCI5997766.1 50S ribosomal protein L19 [Parvimonas sp.]MDD7765309.1 50S ribosomal protein L19 [Peptoniphilaceae bacterium]MDY3050921.1 50S ribosomal protein L19 [Parvimonas sp.]
MDIIRQIENEQLRKETFDFNVGDTIVVGYRVKEGNRERVQAFEGTVIKIQGKGSRATFTVRRVLQGVGVERTFPVHSPRIETLKVLRRGKVRRAKLFYLRDRQGKAAKVKELKKY